MMRRRKFWLAVILCWLGLHPIRARGGHAAERTLLSVGHEAENIRERFALVKPENRDELHLDYSVNGRPMLSKALSKQSAREIRGRIETLAERETVWNRTSSCRAKLEIGGGPDPSSEKLFCLSGNDALDSRYSELAFDLRLILADVRHQEVQDASAPHF